VEGAKQNTTGATEQINQGASLLRHISKAIQLILARTYNKLRAHPLAGATPRSCEVHHHQLVSCLLQDGLELILQKR